MVISFCKKSIRPFFSEYLRYIVIKNKLSNIEKKYSLKINTGRRTFINFYIDSQYEFKDEVCDVLVLIDEDICMAFNTSSLEYIGQYYIHRRSKRLKYIGSIRDNSFYSANEKSEIIIESRNFAEAKLGVAFREENEFRATDLIFQISPKLPIDSLQTFNNVGFIVTDEEREKYYVVDLSDKIDTIPIKDWIKIGKDEKYMLLRFKEPIWQFEFDLL